MTLRVQRQTPCELLPWDSEFFGRRIAKVSGHTLDETFAKEIDQWCAQQRVEVLYFLANSQSTTTTQVAENHGFNLVDIRITLERAAQAGSQLAKPPLPAGLTIRPADSKDVPALQNIARQAHTDSRFFNDAHFSRAQAQELFATWIRVECDGAAKKVLVLASAEDRPLGYVTCQAHDDGQAGQISLMAIGEQARGQGLGMSLVMAAVEWLTTQPVQTVSVVTQGRNIAAQRVYQRCGFLIQDLQLWYHKWFPTPPAHYA